MVPHNCTSVGPSVYGRFRESDGHHAPIQRIVRGPERRHTRDVPFEVSRLVAEMILWSILVWSATTCHSRQRW